MQSIIDKQCQYEVTQFLMGYPFNTSQIGYDYLIDSIVMVLEMERGKRLRLGKDIYSELAKKLNVNLKYYEKLVRQTLLTVSANCRNNTDIVYPNEAVRLAFKAPTAKSFIYTVVTQILLNRKAKQLNYATN